jgi:hypothetical protein
VKQVTVDAMTLMRGDVEAWLAHYGRAWMQGALASSASLSSADCRCHETPYPEFVVGRDGASRCREVVPATASFVSYEGIAVIDCPAIGRRRRVLLNRRHRRHASPEAAALRGPRIP